MSHTSSPVSVAREERKVLASTLVGTTIEWYDFFIYAQLSATLLTPLFLAPAQESNPAMAGVIAFATLGISFLFRPLGAVIAGRIGDKIGRKPMLVATLVLMGVATAGIGVLPTYAQAGVIAPVLLIILRILQGFSAGGEWGGAALLAVEHAPLKRRGFYGSFPQIGVPLGMILATGLLYVLRSSMSPADFTAWGWRVPFLLSIVLIVVGYIIRKTVEDSPVFLELSERKARSRAPLSELFREHFKPVAQSALIFVGNNAAGYLVIAYFIGYSTKYLKMAPVPVIGMTALASLSWLVFTIVGGWVSDRWGRRKTFLIGYAMVAVWIIPCFMLIETKNLGLYFIAVAVLCAGLGLSYGPQSAMYAEMFPAHIRYSGISIGYAIGAILGGAFAAMIAEYIFVTTHSSAMIGVYIIVLCVISGLAVLWAGETRGRDLSVDATEGTYRKS
jgi:MFS family permease